MFACEGEHSPLSYLQQLTGILGKTSPALLALAFLSHLSLPGILYLLPLLLLLITDPVSHLAAPRTFPAQIKQIISSAGEFLVYFSVLTFVSTLVCGGWLWVEQSWGAMYVLHRVVFHLTDQSL